MDLFVEPKDQYSKKKAGREHLAPTGDKHDGTQPGLAGPQERGHPRRHRHHLRLLRGPRPERRTLGRGRPALHRLRGRHRRGQHRPPPSAHRGSHPRTAGRLHPHRLPGRALRLLRGTGRTHQPPDARRPPEEDRLLHDRRRSPGKRRQDRARRHRTHRGRGLFRRVPRPHVHGHGPDRQGRPLQAGFRPAAGRGLPHPLPQPAGRRHHAGFPAGAGPAVQGRHRPEPGGGHRHRAGPGRRRLQRRPRRNSCAPCANAATPTASC